MITRMDATRYRCFGKLVVELGDFRVLVGENGSGLRTHRRALVVLDQPFGGERPAEDVRVEIEHPAECT